MSMNMSIILLFGLAWPFLGLGFMAIYFQYIPQGLSLISQVLGLFLGGSLSGVVVLVLQSGRFTPIWKWWVQLNYLLIGPIGLLVALLLPAPLGLEGATPTFSSMMMGPLAMALLPNAVIALGLGVMSGIGISIHNLAHRLQTVTQS